MRGWFLLHASKRSDGGPASLPRGCVVGIARIVDCYPARRGGWAWRFEKPVRLKVPIPMKGQVGFFTVPPSVRRKLPPRILALLRRDPLRRQKPA